MSIKPFSQELASQNDQPGKQIASQFLTQTFPKIFCLHTPLDQQTELYEGGDFFIFDNRCKRNRLVEVEIKQCWKINKGWQGYPTIDVAYRKSTNQSEVFIMVNHYGNTLLVLNTQCHILTASSSRKNTYLTNDELFYNVDVNLAKFYSRFDKNSPWKRIQP